MIPKRVIFDTAVLVKALSPDRRARKRAHAPRVDARKLRGLIISTLSERGDDKLLVNELVVPLVILDELLAAVNHVLRRPVVRPAAARECIRDFVSTVEDFASAATPLTLDELETQRDALLTILETRDPRKRLRLGPIEAQVQQRRFATRKKLNRIYPQLRMQLNQSVETAKTRETAATDFRLALLPLLRKRLMKEMREQRDREARATREEIENLETLDRELTVFVVGDYMLYREATRLNAEIFTSDTDLAALHEILDRDGKHAGMVRLIRWS